ncbi:prephenate dehydratase [Aerococcus sp. UMB7533]|uniref:prephenate dehydratase n=1 Tax=Aerococcus sp. UMB7533 TaxID=3046340 RepID=UPI0025516973|nr:prephenate dehydratase domain-containing protein [Aerococcus sp. UMB7533]MDK6855051.1 prephenate dehydratase domain-containing protein [Aerococcus sp. UMB7533]
MKVAYQGIVGSYSEAALAYWQQKMAGPRDLYEGLPSDGFSRMVDDLIEGKIDRAVMPIENSTTGLITRTLDLFRYQHVYAEAEHYQPIRHVLWGIKGAELSQIKQVYSHPEALSQCTQFFTDHPWIQPISYKDTAQAAQFIAQEGDPSLAALSSERCGKIYHLEAIARQVQNESTNMTRFFMMRRYRDELLALDKDQLLCHLLEEHPQASRLMLYVETAHRPGALHQLLTIFNLFNCNLEGLDARPIKDQPFSYGFFIEVDIQGLAGQAQLFWQMLELASQYIQIIACMEAQEAEISYLS